MYRWPAEGEPQKGNAQKLTLESLKSDVKVTLKCPLRDFMVGSTFAPFPGR